MSNIHLDISLTGLLDPSSDPIVTVASGSFDILLSPFYAMEQDVTCVYADNATEYYPKIRKLIFESSIKVDQLLTPARITALCLTAEQAFMLKRNYVICRAAYEFGKSFYRDYLKAVKKTKFLGDLKVSLEIEKEPSLIARISDDARECYEELEDMFGMGYGEGMQSFVKGSNNICNKRSDRQWWPSDGHGGPRISFAATKAATFCGLYKIGAQR